MDTEKIHTKEAQTQKVEELYWDCRNWKSKLRFTEDEITFIERLLNSYVFEPNSPNLFERLQDYQERLKKAKTAKTKVTPKIVQHENNLGGMLECTTDACDMGFYQKHEVLKAKVMSFMEDFQNLKAEIFNYASGILKKRKLKK